LLSNHYLREKEEELDDLREKNEKTTRENEIDKNLSRGAGLNWNTHEAESDQEYDFEL